MQRVKHIPQYTYEDYKEWQGDWELIEGLPFAMSPSANAEHQFVAFRLVNQIGNQLDAKKCKKGCQAYYELDWIVNDETVLRPDISVICGEKITGFIRSAPALIIEILSQSTAYSDRIVKKDIYESEGVKYYLIVDPVNKDVLVYELVEGVYRKVKKSTFDLIDKCSLSLKFDEIWE